MFQDAGLQAHLPHLIGLAAGRAGGGVFGSGHGASLEVLRLDRYLAAMAPLCKQGLFSSRGQNKTAMTVF
jgi:hypothetical protein